MILGSFLGAFLFELYYTRQGAVQALKAAIGSFLGFITGTGLKTIVSVIILWKIFVFAFCRSPLYTATGATIICNFLSHRLLFSMYFLPFQHRCSILSGFLGAPIQVTLFFWQESFLYKLFCDLYSVGRRSLAEVVGNAPEVEAGLY